MTEKEESKDKKEEEVGEDAKGGESIYKGLSVGQIKKLKAKMKEDAAKAAAASGIKVAEDDDEEKKDGKSKKSKGKTGGANSALAEKIR